VCVGEEHKGEARMKIRQSVWFGEVRGIAGLKVGWLENHIDRQI